MNQKETICPYTPTYHTHDLQSGGRHAFNETTFPVAAVLRSIFCHNVYRQTSITANNMVVNKLLLCLLSHICTGLTHTHSDILGFL